VVVLFKRIGIMLIKKIPPHMLAYKREKLL